MQESGRFCIEIIEERTEAEGKVFYFILFYFGKKTT